MFEPLMRSFPLVLVGGGAGVEVVGNDSDDVANDIIDDDEDDNKDVDDDDVVAAEMIGLFAVVSYTEGSSGALVVVAGASEGADTDDVFPDREGISQHTTPYVTQSSAESAVDVISFTA